jgi:hypothetical protein
MDGEAEGESRLGRSLEALLAIVSAAVITYGVLVLGWPLFAVMALFWFENVVIGAFNVLKMLTSGARLGAGGLFEGIATSAFFTLHYGLFTAVHGMFVLLLFGLPGLGRGAMDGGPFGPVSALVERLLTDRDGYWALAAIVLMHAVGFVQWAVATRELPTPVRVLMGAPYGRIVVLHVALIIGAFLMAMLHLPAAGVLLLIALKLGYDLLTLGRDRRAAGEQQAQVRARRLLLVGRRNLR